MAIKPFGVDSSSGKGKYGSSANKIDPVTLDIATGADVTAGTANKILDASKVVQTLSASTSTVPSTDAVNTAIQSLGAAVIYRGNLAAGSNISLSATGNAYIDGLGAGSFRVGDLFQITTTGNVITSSGTVAVKAGEQIVVKTAVAHASITAADIDVWDDQGAVLSVFGRVGAVVAVAGDYTASQITNVPAGTISSITAQAAINELDTEKAATTRAINTPVNSVLAGGGDLSLDRNLVLDMSNAPVVTSAAGADLLIISVAGAESTISKDNLLSGISPLLSTTTGVDLKTVASTPVYTVPTGKTLVNSYAVVLVTAATAITAPATVGYGSNGTQDNLADPQEMVAVFATGDSWSIYPLGKGVSVAAAGVVSLGVDVAATGTSQTATVYFFGSVV